LLSDRLLAAGHEVQHIMPNGSLVEHELPTFARVVDERMIYDGSNQKDS